MSILIELRPEAGPVLVVGGGNVAARKVRTLGEGGFRITVVAPEIDDRIRSISGATLKERNFDGADIAAEPWALVLACTANREVNQRVGELARARNIPVLVADAQAESTFFSPAILRDGDLQVAVSTGGADPALAKSIRARIVEALGPGWGEIIATARTEREARLGRTGDDE